MSNISVPLLDLRMQYGEIQAEVEAVMPRIFKSQQFILGEEVAALEREIAEYCNTRFAVGVSSGTDALIVALMAYDVGDGDEVITTPFTFFATASSIARLGARPVFIDIDPTTYNIDVSQIERRITRATKAIMPVHLFGRCAQMNELNDLAKNHKLAVIEDAAQAIGAEYFGTRVGGLGDIGCFSFFPTKNLGGFGDGGIVTTNDELLYKKMLSLRVHGEVERYYHKFIGGNFRLDELQAAVVRIKLKHLDIWTKKRQENAENYREQFVKYGLVADSLDEFVNNVNSLPVLLPEEDKNGRHVYNQFVIRAKNRDKLKSFLQEQGVGTNVYYPLSLHLQECFKYLGYKPQVDFPESERASNEVLALPIYPELTKEQLSYVVQMIAKFYKS